ncbi:MAG: hypothetical protein ACFCD0_08895 [Gemmataceae bacterium]
MMKYRLEDMVKGWFVGNFEPTSHKTSEAEVGIKKYRAGDREDWHYHKVATEITVVLDGEVEMNGVRHTAGDIIRLEPGEGTDFLAVSDTTTVVVKMPSVIGDKYTE